jgi:hypothetical protein
MATHHRNGAPACNHNLDTCPVHSEEERTLTVVLACLAQTVVVRSGR